MRTVMKATMVGLMAITLGFLLTPGVQSGAGCGGSSGGSSGCQSSSEVSTSNVQDVPDVNQDAARMEELSIRLTSSIADLEFRFSEIINAVEDDRLRYDLEGVKQMVTSIRSDMASYQFLSYRLRTSMGHTNLSGYEQATAPESPHGEHIH